MDPRHAVGQAAEEAAATHLGRAGLSVLARNVRLPEGEIDLVCRDGDILVFVEVKCRQVAWGDAPAAAVSPFKRRRLVRLAQHYLKWKHLERMRCRFDVVSVTVDGAAVGEIHHIRAAFDASDLA